eukprot:Pgem_evm1s17510
MILSLQDMYELGMVIAGLPNPTDIDNDSSLQNDDLLNRLPELDMKDYHNIKEACIQELHDNSMVSVSDWCTLKDAEVTFEINEE